jgi:hypothetical protein
MGTRARNRATSNEPLATAAKSPSPRTVMVAGDVIDAQGSLRAGEFSVRNGRRFRSVTVYVMASVIRSTGRSMPAIEYISCPAARKP